MRRVELAERAIDIAERFIVLGDLPAPGRLIELPELPTGARQVARHYRFTSGPAVLLTPGHVRRYYKWLADGQESPLPTTPRVDLGRLKLLEATLIHYARQLDLADLPS
ncbi:MULTISPECIES: hypothetical protein [unclassified Streptomyces]|uniref:hypothetical protein n=1 Tax=unclassified Streptomyces TaxID=2593676 RepID=UPI0029A09255|nr:MULTISPECIES: hypothetical protein [unclassified Streptomyces]MDX3772385.1 hypothetical protein [Streptomyces sp. AK08-01B]